MAKAKKEKPKAAKKKTAAEKPMRKAATVKPRAVKKVSAKIAAKKVSKIKAIKHKPAKPVIVPKIKPIEAVIPEVTLKAAVAPAIAPLPKIIPPPKVTFPPKVALPPKIISSVKVTPLPVVPKIAVPPVASPELKDLELQLPISVKDLAIKLQEKPSELIKSLMQMGVMSGINQTLDEVTVSTICQKRGFNLKKAPDEEEAALLIYQQPDKAAELSVRAPIVTFMGHVDHGKTSLLDAIRKSKVAESEHGGITQHIGAYRVKLDHGEITFLDTPGHEAFTAMRARGASATDIVVLVVAADDGIMPQTQEAIDHARAAGVSIVVAVNKIDKPQANIDRVKKQLGDLDLKAEDWGGKTITVPVSAKTREGIDNLLEMIILEAQILELKANPNRQAQGVVLEAHISAGKGSVATLLVKNGTLRTNENIIVGKFYGKIRAMFNDHGQSVSEAGPSFPVEVSGLTGVPQAGDQFFVISDEKVARDIALRRQEKEKQQEIRVLKRISLEDLHAQIQAGKIKELNMIIKVDVQGSQEAIKQTLEKLNVSEIKLNFIHEGVGNINSSDVILAVASNALVLGFHVDADERAKELAAKEGIDIRTYSIIYELANDIKQAVEGMLEPKLKKVFLGRVEIRKVFKLSRSGIVAGCFVTKGKVNRNVLVNLVRNGTVVFEGNLSSLKRFKDDVREVAEGFECGLTLKGFDDVQEGDIVEAYEIEKIARKL